MSKNYRLGLIVPSLNTTTETEIPAMLQARTQMDLLSIRAGLD